MIFRQTTPLQFALGLSVIVHALILTVRFVDPKVLERAFTDTPLEVVLVNAKGSTPPEKAQAIAQSSLAGGGDAEAGLATSPLTAAPRSDDGDTVDADARQSVQSLQQQQAMLLAAVRDQLATLPVPDPKDSKLTPEQAAQEQHRRLLLKQLAVIEQRVKDENARPRKRYISPSTREEAYAVYYDHLRHMVERKGTENFPVTSSGRKLYGELTMILTIDRRGEVIDTEIGESSGSAALDRRAEAIARSAGPFGRFTAEMRSQADQLVVVSRFKFSRNETLETRIAVP